MVPPLEEGVRGRPELGTGGRPEVELAVDDATLPVVVAVMKLIVDDMVLPTIDGSML